MNALVSHKVDEEHVPQFPSAAGVVDRSLGASVQEGVPRGVGRPTLVATLNAVGVRSGLLSLCARSRAVRVLANPRLGNCPHAR